MEQWQIIDWPFQSLLDQGAALLSKVPVGLAHAGCSMISTRIAGPGPPSL
jgi:hypothetical protein